MQILLIHGKEKSAWMQLFYQKTIFLFMLFAAVGGMFSARSI